MKKIVCEVCGGMNVRKINGAFVCQDCGIEYSLDDVKKLFVEVDDSVSKKTEPLAKEEVVKPSANQEKYTILNQLKYSIDYLKLVRTKPIKAQSLFLVPEGKKNDNLLEYDEEEIRKLNTYRVEPIDDLYLRIHGTDEIYQCLTFSDVYDEYKNDKKNIFDENKALEQALDITYGDNLAYNIELQFKGFKEKVSSYENLRGEVGKTIKYSLETYLSDGSPVNYSLSKIYEMFQKKNIIVSIKVEQYEKKKKLLKEKYELVNSNTYADLFAKLPEDAKRKHYENEGLAELINPYIKEYGDRIEKVREKLITIVNGYKELKDYVMPALSQVPEKYRNENNLLCLISLFLENRITTIGEGLNMIDTYEFRSEVRNSLNTLNNKMDIIGIHMLDLSETVKENQRTLETLKRLSIANLVVSFLL